MSDGFARGPVLARAVTVEDILKQRIAELEAALRAMVRGYRNEQPARLADVHPSDCDCLRCAVDNAAALLE